MLLLIGSLVLFMLTGVPIAYSMGLSGLLYFLLYQPDLIAVLPARVYAGMNSSVMLSLPLFIVMGHLMNHGGLTGRLIDFCMLFVGRLRGGLGLVSVLTAMVFGGISGSSVSDAASIGQVMIPAMKNKGYPVRTATGLIAASSTMGMIIPPSIPMVIYAFVASESVGRLFLGSLIAGVMVGVFMLGIVLVIAHRNSFPCEEVDLAPARVLSSTLEGGPTLLMPLIVVGSVVTGIATATESAAVGALYAPLVGLLVYRGLTVRDLPKLFGEAILSSANVMIIIAFSGVFTWILALEHVTQMIGMLFVQLQLGPTTGRHVPQCLCQRVGREHPVGLPWRAALSVGQLSGGAAALPVPGPQHMVARAADGAVTDPSSSKAKTPEQSRCFGVFCRWWVYGAGGGCVRCWPSAS